MSLRYGNKWNLAGLMSPLRGAIWSVRGLGLSLRSRLLTRERDCFPLILFALFMVLGISLSLFVTRLHHNQELERELHCLALNVYHEARGEPRSGQVAVARVTLNRVASPRYPDSICKVVYQKRWDRLRRRYVSAFSWTELDRLAPPGGKNWQRATRIARRVYHETGSPELRGVLFYHARHIKPSWARHKRIAARIGRHVFYR